MKNLETGLTDKQKKFCEYYILHWNGARAVIQAGFAKSGATVEAARLLKNEKVCKYLKELRTDIESKLEVSRFRNVQELSKIAYSSVGDVFEEGYTLKDFEKLSDNAKACIKDIQVEERKSKAGVKEIKVRIRMYDKISAIQEINKIMGYNEPDKIVHSGGVTWNETKYYEHLSDDELISLAMIEKKIHSIQESEG
ncbi:MAG: terminase small subunit [Bacteroidota bacterium]